MIGLLGVYLLVCGAGAALVVVAAPLGLGWAVAAFVLSVVAACLTLHCWLGRYDP
jgi:membrane protein implicated in regulation of membrane protease activity